MNIKDLKRGAIVLAVRNLDLKGADVRRGMTGVVFEETGYHGDGAGPLVRWSNIGVCNVYQGDVFEISNRDNRNIDISDNETGELYGTF